MREENEEKKLLLIMQGLQKKYDTADKKLSSVDDSFLKNCALQREQVKHFEEAIENNDTDKLWANDKLTQLAVEKEKAKLKYKEEKKKKEAPKQETQAPAELLNKQV